MEVITKETIETLFNWMGYGNPNSPVWIVGKEEGTLEVKTKKKTPKESILIRSKFNPVMDFGDVWQEKFGMVLGKITGESDPWRFSARFLLALCGESINNTAINKFIIKELGRMGGNHFLAEYLPLPKKNAQSIEDYKDYWNNVKDYWNDLRDIRLEKFTTLIENSKLLKLIITYDNKLFSKDLIKHYDGVQVEDSWKSCNGRDEFSIFKIKIENREIFILETPFFGNGRIHSLDVPDAVSKVKKYVNGI